MDGTETKIVILQKSNFKNKYTIRNKKSTNNDQKQLGKYSL